MTVDDQPAPPAPAETKKQRLRTMTTAERVAAEFNPEALAERMYGAGAEAPVQETRRVVLCLMKCAEIEMVIEELEDIYADDDTFIVEDCGTFYHLQNEEGFEIDLDIMEPLIGHRYDVFDFMVNVTTTIGRAYNDGNKFVMSTKLMGLEEDLPKFRPDAHDEDEDPDLNHIRGAGER
ncbi:MmoB/DmpM family protein [Mycobacterium sp. ENV421]|uniref:MmoB/DmpM family protein n=1 Tax=Mycobacterium sp. ENV421 TaxID=1213407 RepID=UPI000C99E12D|nr:MmoB/DmpM family protein [Mycobacterium sp. ENV421]PND54255.1 MmoB/DmpM family protein [Mycobacterium sp. ENV421]